MASSNRHWPSLFKSKPCNPHHQWQHDINSSSLLSGACQKSPYSSGPGCEERSPEPKPRWNPKPEQIRILEAIFNSGMVNPPREEIRKIRAQLQEYGQVGDANVFYWFQNRKSRSKHKQRQLQSTNKPQSRPPGADSSSARIPVATSSSSSSSERSSSCSDKTLSSGAAGAVTDAIDAVSNFPTASINQTYLQQQPHGELSSESFFFQGQLPGYCFSAADFSSLVGVPEPSLGLCSGILSEFVSQEGFKSGEEEEASKMKTLLHHGSISSTSSAIVAPGPDSATTAAASVACPVTEIQGIGVGGCGASRSAVVFINEVEFEVGVGAVNVREAFGDDAVLLHSSGHPVLVDEWGVTIHPLQHGASYYLVSLSV